MIPTRYSCHQFFQQFVLVNLGILLLLIAACGSKDEAAKQKSPPPPAVLVARVLQQTVPIYGEYVARTEARQNVEIRARVEGFLEKVLFKEGSQVKAGQLLFVIDQRPYKAALQDARGSLDQRPRKMLTG
jgi:multidrug efflux pump subunit AcrA (membrane-fusion protein)